MNGLKTMTLIAVFLLLSATHAFGDEAMQGKNRGRPCGPPPEAYTACEGKSIGEAAQFVSPRGETVSGTCEAEGDRLVLRPDRPRRRPGGRHQGPPPQAFTACEGRSVGDTATFENRHGDLITGTCQQQGDRLVLRPDTPPGPGEEDSADQ